MTEWTDGPIKPNTKSPAEMEHMIRAGYEAEIRAVIDILKDGRAGYSHVRGLMEVMLEAQYKLEKLLI